MSVAHSNHFARPKPGHGEPCNGCGICCHASLCPLALAVFGGPENRKCPAIEKDGDGYACGMVKNPASYKRVRALEVGVAAMRDAAVMLIGSQLGCDCRLEGEEENPAFILRLRQQFYERRARVSAALRTWGVTRAMASIGRYKQ